MQDTDQDLIAKATLGSKRMRAFDGMTGNLFLFFLSRMSKDDFTLLDCTIFWGPTAY